LLTIFADGLSDIEAFIHASATEVELGRWTRSASVFIAAAARRCCATSFTQTESCFLFLTFGEGQLRANHAG
jgi:hypothetical protein